MWSVLASVTHSFRPTPIHQGWPQGDIDKWREEGRCRHGREHVSTVRARWVWSGQHTSQQRRIPFVPWDEISCWFLYHSLPCQTYEDNNFLKWRTLQSRYHKASFSTLGNANFLLTVNHGLLQCGLFLNTPKFLILSITNFISPI